MNRFKISEYVQAKRQFTDVFNLRIGDFHDPILSIAFGCVLIDVLKFDEWLHQRLGSYEDQGLNMQQLVVQHFGSDAWEFLSSII